MSAIPESERRTGKDPAPTREQLLQELGHAVRANQRATDLVDEAATQLMGINRTDGKFLDLLDQHGRMSAGDLARECRLTTGAVTAAIDRLERAGYAQRVPDPKDRRRVLVEPTQRTRALSWEIFGPMTEAARRVLDGYSDEELALLVEFHRLGRELQEQQAAMIHARIEGR
jgi:DNA-binding MarR family transcriptional regulator